MTQEGKVPEWLMTGVTILISKNENSENQGITYLPTVYKTITSITSKWKQKYIYDKNLILKSWMGAAEDQKDKKFSN